MRRVVFLVDGFNLYWSLKDAGRDLDGATTRWLDLTAYLAGFLPSIGGDAQLERVVYFSALASHLEQRKPDVTQRHRDYIECLRATGVQVELSRFKAKNVRCFQCKQGFVRYEEKETDVALCASLLAELQRDSADVAALVTGDTDLAPAIRAAVQMHPEKEVVCIFPYRRNNKELARLSRGFKTKAIRYTQHQLPDPFVLKTGRSVSEPSRW